MTRVASVSSVIAGILVLVGCGSKGSFDAYDQVVSRKGFAVDLEALALPDGHPRCPAGGRMLERPVEEHWDGSSVAAPPQASI
jgi:hypothetical protein